ncbi:MAG: SAM-dependent methyltransferase [Trebonia sp.]
MLHFHDDGSAHVTGPDDDAEERVVLGRLTLEHGRVRVRVNSQRRLERLLRILEEIDAAPEVAGESRSAPPMDFAWGPVPGDGGDWSEYGDEAAAAIAQLAEASVTLQDHPHENGLTEGTSVNSDGLAAAYSSDVDDEDEDDAPAFDTSLCHQARDYDYLLATRRAVRFLAGEAGLSQFLDIGTGIPAPAASTK